MNNNKSLLGVGVLTAFASSLCCITPLVAILAGSGSLAANVRWIEPFRPWLIGITILALGLAWYLQLRPVKTDDCTCDTSKPSFWKTKPFLGIVTLFSAIMLTFPLYADALYPNDSEFFGIMENEKLEYVEIEVTGMTCRGCESHVERAVNELKGIAKVNASYKEQKAAVAYDPIQQNIGNVKRAISATQYEVGNHKSLKSSISN